MNVIEGVYNPLKVLSYWNLNISKEELQILWNNLKYYHIGI